MAAQLTATKGPATSAVLVNRSGHHLLAGTGLAGDEHVGGGFRTHANRLAHIEHGRGPADELLFGQLGGFGKWSRGGYWKFQRLEYRLLKVTGLDRLMQIIDGTGSGRFDGQFQIVLTCHDDDRYAGTGLAELFEEFEASAVG